MPVHDWTRVDAEIFNAFHTAWVAEMQKTLNCGLFPEGYYGLAEYRLGARSLAIRHVSGHRLIALLEIVSPANKDRDEHVEDFLNKLEEMVTHGIHVLLVDLFAPGKHDPSGLHAALLERLDDAADAPPAHEPLTLASYVADYSVTAYWEHLAFGAVLPDMPLFLDPDIYINVPLEGTYQEAWRGTPARWREVLERPNGKARRKRGR